jgi:CheY-like chemotaxis protein
MSVDPTQVPNVLIVEDEMMLRMRAVDLVEDAGFKPVEAVNADEVLPILESAQTFHFCLPIFKCPVALMD